MGKPEDSETVKNPENTEKPEVPGKSPKKVKIVKNRQNGQNREFPHSQTVSFAKSVSFDRSVFDRF